MAADFINMVQEIRGSQAIGQTAASTVADGIYHDLVRKTTEDDGVTLRAGAGVYGSMKAVAASVSGITSSIGDINLIADNIDGTSSRAIADIANDLHAKDTSGVMYPTDVYSRIAKVGETASLNAIKAVGTTLGMESVLVIGGLQAEILSLYADKVKLDSLYADRVILDSLYTDKAKIDSLVADKATLDSIVTSKLVLDGIYADRVAINSIYTDKATLDSLYMDKARLDSIFADKAKLDSIVTDKIKLDSIYADKVKLDALYAEISAISTLNLALGVITNVNANMAAIIAAPVNATLAKQYATANENMEVETGTYSAKHYSIKAENSAGLASTAMSTTIGARDTAVAMLDSFKDVWLGNHAAAPITNADGEPLINGALYFNTTSARTYVYMNGQWLISYAALSDMLEKAANLSDLTDVAAARTNLGVLSSGEVSTAIQNAILSLGATYVVATNVEKAALIALQVGDRVFVQDDGDLKWAQYLVLVVTDGLGSTSTFKVIMDEDTYLNANTAASIKVTYESNLDTNAYTDAEQLKLLGIEIGATADQTKLEIDALGIDAATVNGLTVSTAVPVGAVFTDTTYTDAEIKTKYENNLDTNAFTDAEQLKLSGIAAGATMNSADAVLLARANHTGTQSLTTVTPDNIIGTPIDIDNMTKLFNHSNSSGVMHGCALTNNGDGSVNIASGYAMIRASADAHSTLYKIEVPAHTNFVLLEGLNYISLNWNAGTPVFTTSSSELSFNCLDVCIAYVAVREGVAISYATATEQNVDSNRKTRRLFLQFGRFIHLGSGSSLGNAGALAVSVTAGKFNFMLEELSHTAFDTSVAGTATANVFDMYYRDGIGGWTKTVNQKVVNTTTYDNGTGTLATLGNNKFGVTWFYMILNNPNHLVAIKGEVEYADSASADAATPPVAVPTMVEGLGVLLGYVTYQKSATEISKVFSAFTKTFNSSQAVTHNGLSGLQGGAISDYQHLTTAQVSAVATIESRVVSNTAIAAGTGTKVTYDAKGLVTSSTTLSATDIPVLDTSKLTTGTLPVLLGGTGVTTSTGTGNVVLSDSASLTGIPIAPTAVVGTSTVQLATTAFVNAEISNDTYSKTLLDGGQLDTRYYTETELNNVNVLRADKYLAAQNIANMIYITGNLVKIQYNTATDVNYEVLTYGVDGLSNIAHYINSVLAGNTVLTYTTGDLVSAVFIGV